MSKYILYNHPISPPGYLVEVTLAQKGLAKEYRFVDLAAGEQKQLARQGMHPFGQVPLLVTPDGENLFESWAIFEYLEETYPKPPMLPAENLERAKARSLALATYNVIGADARKLLMHAFGYQQIDDEQLEKARDGLKANFTELENLRTSIKTPSEMLMPFEIIAFRFWQNLQFMAPEVCDELAEIRARMELVKEQEAIAQVESEAHMVEFREKMQGKKVVSS